MIYDASRDYFEVCTSEVECTWPAINRHKKQRHYQNCQTHLGRQHLCLLLFAAVFAAGATRKKKKIPDSDQTSEQLVWARAIISWVAQAL